MIYIENTKLSENFTAFEFKCKDGSREIKIDSRLIQKLQKLRNLLKRPIKIISGYRTESYNNLINGAKNSYHCKGMAADISVSGLENYKLALYAANVGFTGIGIYNDYVHVDVRDDYYYWKN